MTFNITVNTTLVVEGAPQPDPVEIAAPAAITTFTGGNTDVTFTLPADPTVASGFSISNRVAALVDLEDYTGNEQNPVEWDVAFFTARAAAGASLQFTGIPAGDYALVWEARDQPQGSQNIVARSGWSVGTPVTVGASNPVTVPAQMDAPTLSVNGLDITATLAADPADGGSGITGRDLQYRPTSGGTWTLLTNVISPRTVPNLAGTTEFEMQARAKNIAGPGPWSASATATTGTGTPDPDPEPGTVSDALTFENIDALAFQPTFRGVRSGVTLKKVGIDALPSGVSVSGDTINFTGTGVTVEGWDFFGYGIELRDGCDITLIRDCVFGYRDSTNLSNRNAFIGIEPSSRVRQWDWCSFFGPGYFGDANGLSIPAIRDDVNGSGANASTGIIDLMRRCEFFGWGSDAVKYGNAGLFEFNYFDCGVNLPAGTKRWDANTTYQQGDIVVNDRGSLKAFISKVNNNIGNRAPDKASDSFWERFDPHYDAVNPRRQTGAPQGQIWRACYFNRNLAFSHVTGLGYLDGEIRSTSGGDNNAIRNVRNNGNTDLHNGITVEWCIVTNKSDRNIANPIEAGPSSGSNQNSSIFRNLWIGEKDSGLRISSPSGHVVQNIQGYVTPNGIAAGYDGPAFG